MNRVTVNYFNAAILLVAPGVFLATVGYLLGGWLGILFCSVAYTLLATVACWKGEQALLSRHRAFRLPADQSPGVQSLVRQLALRSIVPMPALFILPEASPRLMVVGFVPRRGSIAMSTGFLASLKREELAAVIAQALHHLSTGESRPMPMAAVIANGLISVSNPFRWSNPPGLGLIRVERQDRIPSEAFLWILIAPVAAAGIRLAVRPGRQFRADDASTRLIGDPEPLCAALLKMKRQAPSVEPDIVSPATDHLFLCEPPFQQGWSRCSARSHP
jgi:heat shock protein HtpX